MKKLLALLAATTMLTTQVHAAAIALGTQELRLNGGIDFDSPVGTDIGLNLGYGYFVADYLEIGGLFTVSDNDLVSTLGLGGFVEYNIETETDIIPFVGGQLRYLYADVEIAGNESAFALGLYAGTKFFVTTDLAITPRLFFEIATEDLYLEDDKVSDTDFGIDLGLSYFF